MCPETNTANLSAEQHTAAPIPDSLPNVAKQTDSVTAPDTAESRAQAGMSSDPAPAETPNTDTAPPSKASSKTKPQSSLTRQLVISALWGILIGALLSYPLYLVRNIDWAYVCNRVATHEIASEFSGELQPIYEGYELLRREFFRELSPNELLNGAILGFNAVDDLHKSTTATLPLIDDKSDEKTQVHTFVESALKAFEGTAPHEDLIYGALHGMARATGDPFTCAMNEEETKELRRQLGGEDYCGVGVYIEGNPPSKPITVIETIAGGPAAAADLQGGDILVAIDGKPTDKMTLEVASQAIRGPADSKVILTIKRGANHKFKVTLVRKALAIKSVTSKMLADHNGYVRLRFFGTDTGKDCHDALRELVNDRAEGIILDLRNNSGGAITEAITVASQFLRRGQLITNVVNPRIGRHESYESSGDCIAPLPLVVLVNEYSASASEILAGAIKDHKRGLLVGSKTYGKGSVQVIRMVGDKLALKYTVAHYLTPSSHDIHMKGIQPDVTIEAPFSNRLGIDSDKQFQEAIKQLNKMRAEHEHPQSSAQRNGNS